MMRIALITLHTPTPNNCRGASALPYHLMAFRPKDVDVEVWSFNLNGCSARQIEESEARLGVKDTHRQKSGMAQAYKAGTYTAVSPKANTWISVIV